MIIFQKKKKARIILNLHFFQKIIESIKDSTWSYTAWIKIQFQIQDYYLPLIFFITVAYSVTSSTDTSLFVIMILIKIEFIVK